MNADNSNHPQVITVTTSHTAEIRIVHVAGEVDMSSVEPMETAVLQELAAQPRGMVIDLLDVNFCGSSGLRVLLQARQQADSAHIGLRVVANAPAVLRVLEISGMTVLFDVRDSVSEAMRELAA